MTVSGERSYRHQHYLAGTLYCGRCAYGVLFDDDKWREFVDAVVDRGEAVTHVFAVTRSLATFQQMLTELPSRIAAVPLYSHYLDNFELNTKGRS